MTQSGEPMGPGSRMLDALADAVVTLVFFAAAWGSEALRGRFVMTPVLEATALAFEVATAAVAWINLAQILWYRTPLHWLGRLRLLRSIRRKFFVDHDDEDDGNTGGGLDVVADEQKLVEGSSESKKPGDTGSQGYLRTGSVQRGESAVSTPSMSAVKRLGLSCVAAIFVTPILVAERLLGWLTATDSVALSFLLVTFVGLIITFGVRYGLNANRAERARRERELDGLRRRYGEGASYGGWLAHSDSAFSYHRVYHERSTRFGCGPLPMIVTVVVAVLLVRDSHLLIKIWTWISKLFS